jgi:hypothetical protein
MTEKATDEYAIGSQTNDTTRPMSSDKMNQNGMCTRDVGLMKPSPNQNVQRLGATQASYGCSPMGLGDFQLVLPQPELLHLTIAISMPPHAPRGFSDPQPSPEHRLRKVRTPVRYPENH